MRLAAIKNSGDEVAALATPNGVVLVKSLNRQLNKAWSTELFELIRNGDMGDVVECHIDGFEKLVNPVRDLKEK